MNQRAGAFEASIYGGWDSLRTQVTSNNWQTTSGFVEEFKPFGLRELSLELTLCKCKCHRGGTKRTIRRVL